MDPELAMQLFEEGAFLIILDVPLNTEFGIDLYSWNTGEKFKGLKMIPPGIHFVYYSAVSKDGQTAPRTGFFHNFKKKEILVKFWDARAEDIKDEVATKEQVEQFRANLKQLDRNLGPYPYDIWKDWVSLTQHITDDVLFQLVPLNNKISSASDLIPDPSQDDNSSSKRQRHVDQLDKLLPKMMQRPGTEIRFTKFPERNHPDDCSASEISKHNLDLTYVLEKMSLRYGVLTNGILAEYQLCFVCFVIGQVYDAFEQWQRLLRLFCFCDDALSIQSQLFCDFISVLHFQLKHLPKDLFVDIVSGSNFLTTNLQIFFRNVESNDNIAKHLVEKAKRFRSYLTKTMKWDFDVESEEDAPVVVELY